MNLPLLVAILAAIIGVIGFETGDFGLVVAWAVLGVTASIWGAFGE